jgi:hypothetical protein
MKKLFLLFGLLICLCSCEQQEAMIKQQKQETVTKYFNTIRHFEYDGHKYISFEQGYSKAATRGVVHDPDCHCVK